MRLKKQIFIVLIFLIFLCVPVNAEQFQKIPIFKVEKTLSASNLLKDTTSSLDTRLNNRNSLTNLATSAIKYKAFDDSFAKPNSLKDTTSSLNNRNSLTNLATSAIKYKAWTPDPSLTANTIKSLNAPLTFDDSFIKPNPALNLNSWDNPNSDLNPNSLKNLNSWNNPNSALNPNSLKNLNSWNNPNSALNPNSLKNLNSWDNPNSVLNPNSWDNYNSLNYNSWDKYTPLTTTFDQYQTYHINNLGGTGIGSSGLSGSYGTGIGSSGLSGSYGTGIGSSGLSRGYGTGIGSSSLSGGYGSRF